MDVKHVGQPNIVGQEEFFDYVRGAFDRKWLTNDGPYVRELEKQVCLLLAVRNCVAVANGTLGLQLVARALAQEGEVIMPSFTFIATPHAALWEGLTPVFVDIDPETHCIDPQEVEKRITDATVAICGVHLWGNLCDVRALQRLADDNGLALYYDAAHAFDCGAGGFGDAEVFSFHATKFFHTFEGGAITTNDDDLAEHLRMMRNFGFPGDLRQPQCLGINAKMSEIAAAMGLVNLRHLDDIERINRRNYRLYAKLLMGDVRAGSNYQYVVIEVDNAAELKEALWEQGIRARNYFNPPCHLLPPYNYPVGSLPVTERIASRTLCLPTGTNVSEDDVRRICEIIRGAGEQ